MGISSFRKKPDTFDYGLARICKVCGTQFHGRFCNRCGEKVFEPQERTLLTFLKGLLNAVTSLDGKLFNSLILLVTKPGQLSRSIADGVRSPYMKMISLFFFANSLYFLIPSWDSYNSSLKTQMNFSGRNEMTTRIVNERLEKDNLTLAEFTKVYQAQSTDLSKILLLLVVLMFALVLAVVCYSKKNYFADHLLFSMEYFSFHIIVNLLFLTYLFYVVILIGGKVGFDARFLYTDQVFSMITWVTSGYFMIRGLTNLYGQAWYGALIRTVILYFLLAAVVDVYRRMLFFITMWTI